MSSNPSATMSRSGWEKAVRSQIEELQGQHGSKEVTRRLKVRLTTYLSPRGPNVMYTKSGYNYRLSKVEYYFDESASQGYQHGVSITSEIFVDDVAQPEHTIQLKCAEPNAGPVVAGSSATMEASIDTGPASALIQRNDPRPSGGNASKRSDVSFLLDDPQEEPVIDRVRIAVSELCQRLDTDLPEGWRPGNTQGIEDYCFEQCRDGLRRHFKTSDLKKDGFRFTAEARWTVHEGSDQIRLEAPFTVTTFTGVNLDKTLFLEFQRRQDGSVEQSHADVQAENAA